jgi:hypothetical protein
MGGRTGGKADGKPRHFERSEKSEPRPMLSTAWGTVRSQFTVAVRDSALNPPEGRPAKLSVRATPAAPRSA